jgi:methionyl-tRNA synthetase
MKPKRYTITAALPYANGPLHIGHLAGAYIGADIYARYLRSRGEDVVFVCGSDEHGAAITVKARKENTSPKAIIDKYHAIIRDSFKTFGISFDIYHRTSEPIHYKTSQDIFRRLYEKGAFEVVENEQYYDEEAHQFLADRYIIGTCPKCSNPSAYGDQCEKCGSTLSPSDLISPKSALTQSVPTLKTTKHWFLKLDEQQKGISKWIEGKEGIWKNHVLGQCKSWLNEGLRPRAMTRDLEWGIPVPPEVEGSEGKVLYVWLDAPIGYISATKQLFAEIDSGEYQYAQPQSPQLLQKKSEDWKQYWHDAETQLIHFIGKDNIVFHCITFPAILKEHGEYILPYQVPANEFMNLEGDKISTSRNWAVWLHEYLDEFPGREDELRYVLISNMPENKDSEFTWSDYQAKVNNELVANIGNFVNRVAVLIHKYFNGKIPISVKLDYTEQISEAVTFYEESKSAIAHFKFKEAMQAVMKMSSVGNKLLADTEPWKMFKTDISATSEVLYAATQIIQNLQMALIPLLPFTAQKIARLFGIENNKMADTVSTPGLLFAKVEDKEIELQISKLMATKQSIDSKNDVLTNAQDTFYKALKEEITFDIFSKLDMRTGIIISAAKVPKSDKLLQLEVDLGFEKRNILSGIATHFSPEDIVGQEVVVVANLAPRVMRGIASNGMILMAEDDRGKLIFVQAKDVKGGFCVS